MKSWYESLPPEAHAVIGGVVGIIVAVLAVLVLRELLRRRP